MVGDLIMGECPAGASAVLAPESPENTARLVNSPNVSLQGRDSRGVNVTEDIREFAGHTYSSNLSSVKWV